MKCMNCGYEGIIDNRCPQCSINIYSDEYKSISKEEINICHSCRRPTTELTNDLCCYCYSKSKKRKIEKVSDYIYNFILWYTAKNRKEGHELYEAFDEYLKETHGL